MDKDVTECFVVYDTETGAVKRHIRGESVNTSKIVVEEGEAVTDGDPGPMERIDPATEAVVTDDESAREAAAEELRKRLEDRAVARELQRVRSTTDDTIDGAETLAKQLPEVTIHNE